MNEPLVNDLRMTIIRYCVIYGTVLEHRCRDVLYALFCIFIYLWVVSFLFHNPTLARQFERKTSEATSGDVAALITCVCLFFLLYSFADVEKLSEFGRIWKLDFDLGKCWALRVGPCSSTKTLQNMVNEM